MGPRSHDSPGRGATCPRAVLHGQPAGAPDSVAPVRETQRVPYHEAASIRPPRHRVLGTLPARRLARAAGGRVRGALQPHAREGRGAGPRRWASAPSTTTRRSCCGGRTSISSTSSPTPRPTRASSSSRRRRASRSSARSPWRTTSRPPSGWSRALPRGRGPALRPRELAVAGPDPGPEGRARRGAAWAGCSGRGSRWSRASSCSRTSRSWPSSSGSSSPTWAATSSTWRASSSARRRPSTAGPPGSTPHIKGEDVATVVLHMRSGATVLVELGYPGRRRAGALPGDVRLRRGRDGLGRARRPDYWLRTTTADGTLARRHPPPRFALGRPALRRRPRERRALQREPAARRCAARAARRRPARTT